MDICNYMMAHLGVSITSMQKRQITELARQRGITVSALIREILDEKLGPAITVSQEGLGIL